MATYSISTHRRVSTSPYVTLNIDVSENAAQAVLSYSLTYHSPNGAANTSAAKEYTIRIGDTAITGTCDINGKTSFTIKEGTVTIAKDTWQKSVQYSLSFGFNLTWSGEYIGTLTTVSHLTIGGKTNYSVTYNANGGTGAPSAQTKWHGETLTLSSTKPTRTGHHFKGWATSANGSVAYQSGGSYTANAAATLYAVWQAYTYVVYYNANGGTGAPATQTKTHGVTLTLSSTKPTRTNYTFKGWAKSATGAVAYSPGGTYTENAVLNLYAVWELSYVLPKIYNTKVEWAATSGIDVAFDWGTTNSNPTASIAFYDSSNTLKHSVSLGQLSGTSGHFSGTIAASNVSTLTNDVSYNAQITINDGGGDSTATITLIGNIYPIDFLAGGKGVAFGGAASLENTAHFQFDVKFDKPVSGMVRGLGKLPKIERNSDFNDYKDFGVWAVYANDDAQYIQNMPELFEVKLALGDPYMVGRAGILEVFAPTGEGLRSAEWSYIRQRFIPYSLSFPVMERDITRNTSNVWNYGNWYKTSGMSATLFDGSSNGIITLAQSADSFEYLEIFFTDNNGELGGYTKIHKPYTKVVNLSIIEAAGTTTYIRRTNYTISGTTMTPDTTNAGYALLNGSSVSHTTGTNYIKITRVIGHK